MGTPYLVWNVCDPAFTGRTGRRHFDKAAKVPAMEPANDELEAMGPLRICTRFLMPLDAEVFAARLQADGIAAVVMDANTLYANGAFHTSLGMGGVRVMVPESQMAEAQRILDAYNAGEFAIDENFDPNP
jgi:hypothetical protein